MLLAWLGQRYWASGLGPYQGLVISVKAYHHQLASITRTFRFHIQTENEYESTATASPPSPE